MKKKLFLSFLAVSILFIAWKLYVFNSNHKASYLDLTSVDRIFKLDVPDDLNFAGEKLPIDNLESREAFDRELYSLTYAHSRSLLLHKRASMWFPVIEPILKAYKVPDDFKYLALAESGLSNAVSPKGATGYWQFVESTALHYGLTINEDVDERYHIERSTEAACRFFKESYKVLKSWTLVAAAYNRGMTGILRQMEKQKTDSYYELLLNPETAAYIYKILSLKEVIKTPEKYGYSIRRKDLYPRVRFKSFIVDTSVADLSTLAASVNATLPALKYFNPWIKKDYFKNPDKKKFLVKIPIDSSYLYFLKSEAQDSIIQPDSLKK